MDVVVMVSPLGLFSRQASHQMLCPYHNNHVHHYRQTFQYYSDRVGNDLGVPPSNDGRFTVLILSQYSNILTKIASPRLWSCSILFSHSYSGCGT